MKKFTKILLLCLCVALIATVTALTVSALEEVENGVYLIYTPEDLVEFASLVENNRKMNAKLMADLDMSGVTYTAPKAGYYGSFDGNGKTISGLTRTVDNAAEGNYGLLFNTVGNGYGEFLFGEIMNLTLKDSAITVTSAAKVNVGALTGKCDRNDIYDVNFVNVDVNLTGITDSSAGLATGYSCWGATRGGNPSIEYFNLTADSTSSVTANGTDVHAGSFVGMHDWDPIFFYGCETNATVKAENGYAGGIIGYQKSGNNPKFFDITVNATVSGKTAGALSGQSQAPEYGIIALDNKTTLELVGKKLNGDLKYEYYDDLATYGKLPKTDDGKYLISTYEELFWFSKFYQGDNNKNRLRMESVALLTADIDMAGKPWAPITVFRGTIDGGGHTLSNITYTVTNAGNDTKHGLLVGTLSNHYNGHIFGVVRNITVKDSTLTVTGDNVKYNVGGIAGESNRGSFYDVTMKNVDITVNGNLNENTVVGGIAGWVAFAPENPGRDYIQYYINCSLDKDSSITSDNANTHIGGIFGTLGSECVYMNNCTVAATLSGKYYTGGLAGSITSGGNRWYMISDCAFFGKITSGSVSGGIVGYASKNGHIIDTTSTGSVEGTTSDAFVGEIKDGFHAYYKRNSDGGLTVKDDGAVSLYCQTRKTDVGHDLRVVLLADMAKIAECKSLTVKTVFSKANGTTIKTHTGTLDGSANGYKLFKSITAGSETYTAEEGSAIFGHVITDIPNGAYDYVTVTVTDDQNTIVASGSTKKTESSLEGKTFYFLGSSVTYGSAANGKSMVELIAERNNCTTVKDAVSGTTLVDNDGGSYVSRLKNSTVFDKNAKVDHFIIQLSTNDAGQNKPLGKVSDSKNLNDFDTQTIIGAMEYIICYCKETWGCEVSFYTGTCYNSNLYVQMITALYDLQDKWGIGVIDMFFDADMTAISAPNHKFYMSDPVHPNIKGYEFWWTPVFEAHLKSFQYQ